jgi:hypothetical protein
MTRIITHRFYVGIVADITTRNEMGKFKLRNDTRNIDVVICDIDKVITST